MKEKKNFARGKKQKSGGKNTNHNFLFYFQPFFFLMVKFENLDGIPVFLVEGSDTRDPAVLQREIIGYLCVLRACSQLYGRRYMKQVGRALVPATYNINEVRQRICEVMEAWFRNANLRLNGIRKRAAGPWVNQRERLIASFLRARTRGRTAIQQRAARRYQREFSGDISHDAVANLELEAAESIVQIAYRNMKEIMDELNVQRERPALYRRLRIVKEGADYNVMVSNPVRREQQVRNWTLLARLSFSYGPLGETIMEALKEGRRGFNFETLDTLRQRERIAERVEEAIDNREQVNDMFDDNGVNLDDDRNDEEEREEVERGEAERIRDEEYNELSTNEKRVFRGCGGFINPYFPRQHSHDLMDTIYSYFTLFKFVAEVDYRDIYEYASNMCFLYPKTFVMYQRYINIPILLFLSLCNEKLFDDLEDDEGNIVRVTLGTLFRATIARVQGAAEFDERERTSILFYKILGFVTGFYGVMTSTGIYGDPLKMKKRRFLANKLNFPTIFSVFDSIEQGSLRPVHFEEDIWQPVNDYDREERSQNEADIYEFLPEDDDDLPIRYQRRPRLTRGMVNTRSASVMLRCELLSRSIDEILCNSLTIPNGEDVPFGAYLPDELFDQDALGPLLSRMTPMMLFMYIKAIKAGGTFALMKMEDEGFLDPHERSYWRCRLSKHNEANSQLDISIVSNTEALDDPTRDAGNREKYVDFFMKYMESYTFKESEWKMLHRCVLYVMGEEYYEKEKAMGALDDLPDEPLRFVKVRDRHFVGRVYYHERRRIVQADINGWDDKNIWFNFTTQFRLIKKYCHSFDNMVFFKKPGCFYRALKCTCEPVRDTLHERTVKFCDCQDDVEEYPMIKVGDMENEILTNYSDKAIMVVAFLLDSVFDGMDETLREQYGQQVRVVYKSDNFYESDESIVIFVSVPTWDNAIGHCAVWKNKCEGEDKEGIKRFRYLKKFNMFLRSYLNNPMEICPVCGSMYLFGLDNQHYVYHTSIAQCDECGLGFDSGKDLETHQQYHCKHPRYNAKLELCEDEVVYKDKGPLKDTLVVYADLESAIDENGKHNNILAGWVAWDEEKEVHIENSVEEMLEAWYKLPSANLLIYFHNGKGYDFHFIIETCTKLGTLVKDFEIVADSSEKVSYFQFRYKNRKTLMFRDTFAFVSTSLEKWTESSKESGAPFVCFNANFDYDHEKRDELKKKNPFPYAAIKKAEDLNQDFNVMYEWAEADNAEELFCYKFTKEEIRGFAKRWHEVRLAFKWDRVRDYYVDYLICDVSQLADNMEFFCDNVKQMFEVDAHQYFGVPSLTWAIWLKTIAGTYHLDPITDPEMYDVINSSIRGGQTGAMTRYYDVEEQPDTFVVDLDCNSLYPTAMMKFSFPTRDWRKLDWSAIRNFSQVLSMIKELHNRGRSGFIELDFIVKDKEEFYSYVPVASKRIVKGVYEVQSMVEYCAEYGNNVSSLCFCGLTQVMGKHEHYCCHTRLLEWYLEHDVIEITKLHRIITGEDHPVFYDYVKSNLEKRSLFSSDPIKKMLYKLMNNSLYGKTYEDVTKRSDFRLVRVEEFEKMDPSTIYREIKNFDGGWKLIECKALTCKINKPVYLGAAITEFSKLWMYQFFYDKIRPAFPNTEVFYTDTDALTICFKGYGITSLRQLAERLNTNEEQIIDTSNFKEVPTEPRHCKHNTEAGLFKSETGEARILKMVALRAKTYIMVCEGGEIKMSVKGCPIDEKKGLSFDLFKSILFDSCVPYSLSFNAIRSEGHQVFSKTLERVVLSADDRKRFILPDRIHTAPLFSKVHLEAIGKVGLPSGIEFP